MKAVSLILLSVLLVISGAAQINEQDQSVNTAPAYADSELYQLILHNLELLAEDKLSDATKSLINSHGAKTLLNKVLLNYLFLVDSNQNNIKTAIGTSADSKICSTGDLEGCIVNILYNKTNAFSFVKTFEKQHGSASSLNNYYYSSDKSSTDLHKNFGLSLTYDSSNRIILVESRTGKNYRFGKTLSECVNDVLDGVFRVDVYRATVYNLKSRSQEGSFKGNEKLFKSFVEDVCVVNAVSSLVRKEPTPSLFTFYINTLGKLQNAVGTDAQKQLASSIWDLAQTKFVENIRKKFDDEFSGQVVLMNNTNSIAMQSQDRMNVTRQVRMLDDDEEDNKNDTLANTTTVFATNTSNNTGVPLTKQALIFRIFGVGFVIVLALILVAMSSIEIQKDTLVYSKFLTVDPRR